MSDALTVDGAIKKFPGALSQSVNTITTIPQTLRNLSNTLTVDSEYSATIVLAAAASNVQMVLPNFTGNQFVYVETVDPTTLASSTCTVAINSSGNFAMTVNGFLLLFTTGVASLYLTNPNSVNTVSVFVYMAG